MRAGVLWTNLSQRGIAGELCRRGFAVSTTVVKGLLRRHRLGRRKAKKNRSLKQHRRRDRQFRNIARLRAAFEQSDNPILSVDTKKKEFIGELFGKDAPTPTGPRPRWTTTSPAPRAAWFIRTASTTSNKTTAT